MKKSTAKKITAQKITTTEEIDRQLEKDIELIQGFRLIDDVFMSQCFDQEPAPVQLVLRLSVKIPNLKVTDARTQVNGPNLTKRSVRYDVLATDSESRKYNIEIQRTNAGADPLRGRYNSSMMDVNYLPKGASYTDLPEIYVLFITEHDIYSRGKPVYRIDRREEDGDLYKDKEHIIYVNGAYRGDAPMGRLMHDFFCTNPDDMYYEVLADRVRYFKENKEGVKVMCDILQKVRNEGKAEERAKNTRDFALRLLTGSDWSTEKISRMSDLPVEEVEKLKAKLQA